MFSYFKIIVINWKSNKILYITVPLMACVTKMITDHHKTMIVTNNFRSKNRFEERD